MKPNIDQEKYKTQVERVEEIIKRFYVTTNLARLGVLAGLLVAEGRVVDGSGPIDLVGWEKLLDEFRGELFPDEGYDVMRCLGALVAELEECPVYAMRDVLNRLDDLFDQADETKDKEENEGIDG